MKGTEPQDAVWASGTFNKGGAPCRAVVTGDGGGGFAVLDSTNAVLFSAGAYSPVGTPYGQLPVGGVLQQVGLTRMRADALSCSSIRMHTL